MSYKFKVTIASSQVPSTQTDFIFEFHEGVSSIPSEFWSGVSDSEGLDIRFFSSDDSTELERTVNYFDSSGQRIHATVRIPSLSNSVDTDIWVHYGGETRPDDPLWPTGGLAGTPFEARSEFCAVIHCEPEHGASPMPPSGGLAFHLKSDTGVSSSSGRISNWADQSGNGNDAAQATGTLQPLLVSDQAGGYLAIRFDLEANPGRTLVVPAAPSLYGAGNGYTIFMVLRVRQWGNNLGPYNLYRQVLSKENAFKIGNYGYNDNEHWPISLKGNGILHDTSVVAYAHYWTGVEVWNGRYISL